MLIIVLSALAAYLAVRWIYFKILKVAKDKVIVDNPNARKLQKTPVPILGGIAVFFGVIIGVTVGAALKLTISGAAFVSLTPILCSMLIMVYIGAMDDIIGLTPRTRFMVEILTLLCLIYASGGCIDSFHGLWGIGKFSWWLAAPLTVFAGVGIINAVNMIDGVNGLCSGLCICCGLMFGIIFVRAGDIANSVLAFAVSASLLPFLLRNVFGSKSRMFLGDAGTMTMGMVMTWFTISLLRADTPVTGYDGENGIALALAILSVPVFDTVRVMAQRIYHGKSPFHPDKTHLHHIFVRAGVSHSITALIEIFIDLLIVGIWALSVALHCGLDAQLYIVVAAALILVWGLFTFIRIQEKRHTEFMHRLTKFGIKTHLGHTERWLAIQRWLDAPAEELEQEKEKDVVSLMDGDKKMVYDFMKGKSEVFLDDIKKRSGAEPESVEAIVYEGIESGLIMVVKQGVLGVPNIVALKEEQN